MRKTILFVLFIALFVTSIVSASVSNNVIVSGGITEINHVNGDQVALDFVLGIPYSKDMSPSVFVKVFVYGALALEWDNLEVGDIVTVKGVIGASSNYAFRINARGIELGNTIE